MFANPRPPALRARRKPSPRNMQIYEEVRLLGRRQEEVAARHGLKQQRVSQICQQIDRWHEWATRSPNYEAIEAEERRQRLLAVRNRQEQVLLVALKQAVQPSQTLVTERRVTDRRGTSVERTEKVLPTSPAWLTIALQASSSVARLGDKLEVDVESSALAEEIDSLLAELMSGGEAQSQDEPKEGANSCTSCKVNAEFNGIEHQRGEAISSPKHWAGTTCGESGAAHGGGYNREEIDKLAHIRSLVRRDESTQRGASTAAN